MCLPLCLFLGFDGHNLPECARMCPNVPECACVMALNVPLLRWGRAGKGDGGAWLLFTSPYVFRDVRSAHGSQIAGIETGSPALTNSTRKN